MNNIGVCSCHRAISYLVFHTERDDADYAGLDWDFVNALPADVRAEVLRDHKAQVQAAK